MAEPGFQGITPYLLCRDADRLAAWLRHSFGFVEKSRWHDDAGALTNVELMAGDSEIWLDDFPDRPDPVHPPWIGVWVDDIEAMRARILAAGVDCAAPRERAHGVREIGCTDAEGNGWGFLQRLAPPADR